MCTKELLENLSDYSDRVKSMSQHRTQKDKSLLKTNLCTFSRLMTMCSLVYMSKSSYRPCYGNNVHRNGFQCGIRQHLKTRQKRVKGYDLFRGNRLNDIQRKIEALDKCNCFYAQMRQSQSVNVSRRLVIQKQDVKLHGNEVHVVR